MATTAAKSSPKTKAPAAHASDVIDRRWKLATIGVLFFSVTYLFLGEPYFFSRWRQRDRLGDFQTASEIEKRDAYGHTEWAESRIDVFVGDKIDADFNEPGVFRSTDGREQTVSYPFRVHFTSEKEILFSPLLRRTQPITWVSRRPQKELLSWDEILRQWTRLKKEWAEFKVAHPLRGTASEKKKGKAAPAKGRGKVKGRKGT